MISFLKFNFFFFQMSSFANRQFPIEDAFVRPESRRSDQLDQQVWKLNSDRIFILLFENTSFKLEFWKKKLKNSSI